MKDENFYQAIINSVSEGICVLDCHWKVVFFNRAAEQITGFPAEAVFGKKYLDIFSRKDCGCRKLLEITIRTGTEFQEKPGTIMHNEDHCIPIKLSTKTIRGDDGKIAYVIAIIRDVSSLEYLRRKLEGEYKFENIISKNHHIRQLFQILPNIARSDSSCLITGPSGSGKELFARAIHNASQRHKKPFVAINCGALPENLLESELFGFKKGAFTDAFRDKPGRFALAEGGTLFLDEIAELPASMQVKLLRVLQEKEYEPLGATASVKTNVRIVSATNQNLRHLINEGHFRMDLFYRLNIVEINLPPLRERKEDIPLLTNHFIQEFNAEKNRQIREIDTEAMQILISYAYPGNIRELENIIEHAFILCRDDIITADCLPQYVFTEKIPAESPYNSETAKPENSLEERTINIIKEHLSRFSGNRSLTAKALGIDKSTLWRKMKKYNIS
jgi:PAS domain S-box-containing protein